MVGLYPLRNRLSGTLPSNLHPTTIPPPRDHMIRFIQQGKEKKFFTQWVADVGGRNAGKTTNVVGKTINFVYTHYKYHHIPFKQTEF